MLGTILITLAAFMVQTNGHRLLARLDPKPPEPTPETLAAIADRERRCAALEEQIGDELHYGYERWRYDQTPEGQATAVRYEQARLADYARVQAFIEAHAARTAEERDAEAAAFAAATAPYDHATQLSLELS